VVSPREGDLLFGRRFLGLGWGSLVLEQGSLKLVRWRSCLALSAATWRERSSILQKCGVFGRWINASECRLGCDLKDVVCTTGCGVQATLMLTGENGLYVG
jgi:hypothetical protein